MNPYIGLSIGGFILVFFLIGVGLCIRCMSKYHNSGVRDVSGENESVLSETAAQSWERNRIELILEHQEQSETIPTESALPKYDDIVNNVEVNGTNTEGGLGKVQLGEESPPHYEVAKEKEDLNSEPAL